jgi:hypothetical protein
MLNIFMGFEQANKYQISQLILQTCLLILILGHVQAMKQVETWAISSRSLEGSYP